RRKKENDVENVCRARFGNHATGPLRFRSAAALESHENLSHSPPVRRKTRGVRAPCDRIRGNRGALLTPTDGRRNQIRGERVASSTALQIHRSSRECLCAGGDWRGCGRRSAAEAGD